MKTVVALFGRVSMWLDNLGGIILVLMMLLTVADVILRMFGKPITGTYELVALAGAMVVGFAIPQTTRENGHVGVDILVEGRTQKVKNIFFVITKLMGVVLFTILSWYLFKKGNHLLSKGDVSHTLQIPAYPGAYVMAVCALAEALVLLVEIPRRLLTEDNNG